MSQSGAWERRKEEEVLRVRRAEVGWRAGGWVVAALLGGCVAALGAQGMPPVVQESAAAAAPVGTVTGRVMAQDTQQPARFVAVILQSVAAAAGNNADGQRFSGGGGVNTRTDAEGEFMASVAPGDYYVTAGAPGYVNERALLQAAVAGGADPGALLAGIPQVHVDAGGSASVTVTMERGGTIAGKVLWEDGSPAAGISINALPGTASGTGGLGFVQLPGVLQGIQSPFGGSNFTTTDDRGAFRIAGLAPGEYLLRTTIAQPMQQGPRGFNPSPIMVFSPGVFRRAEAKTVVVKAGEERGDVRMMIDLRALRTVSGHVGSSGSGQTVASGRVTLSDPNDKDLQVFASIAANGEFAVRYVPAGSYTLSVTGASTQSGGRRGRGEQNGGVSFQPFSEAVMVSDTDVSGVGITLTPVTVQP